jgi:multicomponent Na+:H+ antiporter subunit E
MRRALSSVVSRGTVLVAVWWALTEGQPGTWGVGLSAVAVAVGTSLALSPPTGGRLHPLAAARFAFLFLERSFLGGIDVALRALDPRRPLAPAFLDYPLRLPDGAATIFFANTVSLLPGTLSTSLEPRVLRIHLLDARRDAAYELGVMEERIAALFGVSLDGASPAHR